MYFVLFRDLPQTLQDMGGWPNETLAQEFANYSRILYREFGDRVKDWITFNGKIQILYFKKHNFLIGI